MHCVLSIIQFSEADLLSVYILQGVPKNLQESGEQYIVVSQFSSVFPGCLTRGIINAARIVLFKFYN